MPNVSEKVSKTILIETFVHTFLQDILLPSGSTKIVNIHYEWASTLTISCKVV